MDFEFSGQQASISDAIARICADFGDDYWLARDRDGQFPEEFVTAITIGKEGEGWQALLHGLNPERIVIAAEAVGLGQVALERASKYARERVVFDRTIGHDSRHRTREPGVDQVVYCRAGPRPGQKLLVLRYSRPKRIITIIGRASWSTRLTT